MSNFLINIFTGFFILLAVISMFISKAHANEEWTKDTFALQKKIVQIGVQLPIAKTMINECKRTAKNPLKCVKTATAIYGNESGFWKHCLNYSCWGVVSKKYSSKEEALKDWINRYNRLWFKHNWWAFFYWWKWWLGKSGYCTEEHSSNTAVGCPMWTSTFNYFYSIIKI